MSGPEQHPARGPSPFPVLSSRVLLTPADMDRSLRFYGDTLGLHVHREWGEGPSRGVVFFLGGGFLELSATGPMPRGPAGPGRVRLWLQVPDLQAAQRALAAAGASITSPPSRRPWGLLEMTVLDPDSLELVLVEVPPEHPLRMA